jgi:hypothetical protein
LPRARLTVRPLLQPTPALESKAERLARMRESMQEKISLSPTLSPTISASLDATGEFQPLPNRNAWLLGMLQELSWN